MPADQAAGLRRRASQQPLRSIHCFFEAAASTPRLAHALHQLGQVVLLVDMQGRQFADSTTRSLFEWKLQLERGHFNTLPQTYGSGWHAPGIRASAQNLQGVLQGYDTVLWDVGQSGNELALMPGSLNAVIIEVQPAQHSMQRAYRLLKTLSRTESRLSIGLLGEVAACDQVLAACRHFLEQGFAQIIYNAAAEDDAFAVLAVRMADEETHRMTRCI